MFNTHFRRWVAETIGLTYENSSESDLPTIRSHEVRAVAALVVYYRNTPLNELCGLISWKSSNVFIHQYLRDMAADTDLQELPVVSAGTTLISQVVLHNFTLKLTTSSNKVNFDSLSMSGGNIR